MSTIAVLASDPHLTARLVGVAMVAVLGGASLADFRRRRIPNKLVFIGLLVALAWQSTGYSGSGLFDSNQPGALGLVPALAGAAAAFGVFLILHLARAMGAGDVKLAAMLGAFFGIELLPHLVLSIFLMGGLLAAVRMLNAQRRRAVLANLQLILFERLATFGGGAGPRFDPNQDTADRLPFALAISGGAILLAALTLSGTVS